MTNDFRQCLLMSSCSPTKSPKITTKNTQMPINDGQKEQTYSC